MTDHEPAADETAALRARISALSAASLRISASLDLETVLNEVVESARALTGARYGAIATIDEAGAEDYVVKPFSPTELTARIRAALRRRSNPVPFVLGELAIDYDRRRVTVAGRAVTLTPTEYELLRALAQGAGRILTHEDLLRQVWAGRGHGKVKPKIVRAYVKRLRHRLGDDAARPAWIVNERGVATACPAPARRASPDRRSRPVEPTSVSRV